MTATGKALEVLGIDPKYCTNCICRMMCKGKVCELARTMVGLEINPDEICCDLAVEPSISISDKRIEQIVGFTWMCRQKTECKEKIICPVKEERIRQIFLTLIRKYNEKPELHKDHTIILSDDIVLLVEYAPGRGWSYRSLQAEKW